MTVGFTDEEEVRAAVEDALADRLAAVQVVPEEDRLAGEQSGQVGVQPALGGVALAALLALLLGQVRLAGRRVVLGLDKLRHEREHAVVAVGDDGGGEHGVEVLLALVLADMAGGALVAVDGVRAVELDADESDEQVAVEPQEGCEGAVVAEGVEAEGEEVVEGGRVATIEQIADVIVARDAVHAEEGVAVGAEGLIEYAALEVQEGRGLE